VVADSGGGATVGQCEQDHGGRHHRNTAEFPAAEVLAQDDAGQQQDDNDATGQNRLDNRHRLEGQHDCLEGQPTQRERESGQPRRRGQ